MARDIYDTFPVCRLESQFLFALVIGIFLLSCTKRTRMKSELKYEICWRQQQGVGYGEGSKEWMTQTCLV